MRDGCAQRERRTLHQMQPGSQIQHVCEAGSPLTPEGGSGSVRHLQSMNFSTLRTPPEVPQHQQPSTLLQPNEQVRSLETTENLAPQSPTPFRPMPPREFSLGNNVRRMYPDLPLRTLPPDVSKSASAARALRAKAEAHADVSRSANFARVTPENTDATSTAGGPLKSIFFTRRSSTASRRSSISTLHRIPEEEDSISSGFSSKFSAPGDFMDNATGDGEVFPTTQSRDADDGFLSLSEIKKVGEQAVDVLSTESSKLYALLVKDELRTCNKSMTRSPRAVSRGLVPPEVSGVINQTPSACSEEHQSSSDSSGCSFLSWTESRRSVEYVRSEQYQVKLRQLQHQKQEAPSQAHLQNTQHGSMQLCRQLQALYPAANNSSSPIKALSYTRKISQDSTESLPPQGPVPFHQLYHRRSSQESNDSMPPSPTPFRPMLPRELLLPFKFPVVAFPTLPADATVATPVRGMFGGIYPPQA